MPKILVIDDDLGVCEAIRCLFKGGDYWLRYALSGKDGLDIFEREKPDIVILDMLLGDMPGLEVLREIKAREPECSVIVITGSCSENNKKQAFELGANYFLSKPFSIDELRKIISRM